MSRVIRSESAANRALVATARAPRLACIDPATSGVFEVIRQNGTRANVTDREAAALLRNHARDAWQAVARMRANPYGQLNCEGGVIRYVPARTALTADR